MQLRDFQRVIGEMETLAWCLSVGLMLAGLVGVIVPLLPGTTLILLGAVIHKLLLPADFAWGVVSWIAGLWLLSVVVDFAGVVIGTRMFGGSKWGMAGAGGGAFVGMFISLPALLLGTIGGALLAEKFLAQKTSREALRAGFGAAAGFVVSTIARLALAIAMIAVFFSAVLSR